METEGQTEAIHPADEAQFTFPTPGGRVLQLVIFRLQPLPKSPVQLLDRSHRTDEMVERLWRELYRVSHFADLVAVVPGQDAFRIYPTGVFGGEDGQLIRLWIYFALRNDETVELQNIEAVEADMTGRPRKLNRSHDERRARK